MRDEEQMEGKTIPFFNQNGELYEWSYKNVENKVKVFNILERIAAWQGYKTRPLSFTIVLFMELGFRRCSYQGYTKQFMVKLRVLRCVLVCYSYHDQ